MEWDQLESAQRRTLQEVAQRLAACGRSEHAPAAAAVRCLLGVDRLLAAGVPIIATGAGAADPVVEIRAALRELGQLPPAVFESSVVMDVAASAQAALVACRPA